VATIAFLKRSGAATRNLSEVLSDLGSRLAKVEGRERVE